MTFLRYFIFSLVFAGTLASAEVVEHRGAKFHVYRLDPAKEKLELHLSGKKGEPNTFVKLAEKVKSQGRVLKFAMNSGIFFRCIPGDVMMGYECQVNNGFQDGSRLTPSDWGTGGIFKRQAARVIAGDDGEWSTVLLHAAGNKISAWVNGVQVSDFEDTRDTNENPRRGLRTQAGTIMIQGHDPDTDLLFRNLQISRLGASTHS